MQLREMFVVGGWGMWPISIFGLCALGLAIAHAVRPRSELLPLIFGTGAATLFAGFLGISLGFISTFKYVQQLPIEQQTPIVYVGLGESLSNIVLALMFATLISLVTGYGSFRARRVVSA